MQVTVLNDISESQLSHVPCVNGHQSPKLQCLQIITGCSCLQLSCTDSVSMSLYLNSSSGYSIWCRRSCVGFVWRTLQTSDSTVFGHLGNQPLCKTHLLVFESHPTTPNKALRHILMCCRFICTAF